MKTTPKTALKKSTVSIALDSSLKYRDFYNGLIDEFGHITTNEFEPWNEFSSAFQMGVLTQTGEERENLYLLEEGESLKYLRSLMLWLTQISEREDLDLIKKQKRIDTLTKKSRTNFNRHALYDYWSNCIRKIISYPIHNHIAHPYVQSLIDLARGDSVFKILSNGIRDHEKITLKNGRFVLAGQVLLKFQEDLKKRITSPETLKKLISRQRNYFDNLKQSKYYIKTLFEHHEAVIVQRVDFGLNSEFAENHDRIQNHWKNFWNKLRHQAIGARIIGKIWKMEYTRIRGYHYTCILFIGEEKQTKDQNKSFASLIGKAWCDHLQEDEGRYFNCNKYTYRWHSYFGSVHRANERLRNELQMTVSFMCLKEQVLSCRATSKIRLFGISDRRKIIRDKSVEKVKTSR